MARALDHAEVEAGLDGCERLAALVEIRSHERVAAPEDRP